MGEPTNEGDVPMKYMILTILIGSVIIARIQSDTWREMGLYIVYFITIFAMVGVALSGLTHLKK